MIRVNATMSFRALALTALLLAAIAAQAGSAVAEDPAPAPAWLPIAHSGPTNLPNEQSESQRVAVDAEGGNFTLTFMAAVGEGDLSFASAFSNAYPAGATQITILAVSSGAFAVGQTISGPGIVAGTMVSAVAGATVTLSTPTSAGGPAASQITASSKEVTGVVTAGGSFGVGQPITGAGIPAGTSITSVGAGTLTLSNFPTQAGKKALTVVETTGSIPFDADAPQVAEALNVLASLEGVTVIGGPGDEGATNPYFVTFEGNLENTNVPQLSANSEALTGGINGVALVSTVLEGGPGTSEIVIYPQNVGGLPSSGTVTLEFTLPAGITTAATPGAKDVPVDPWSCGPVGGGQSVVTCTSTEVAGPGLTLRPLVAPVIGGPGASSGNVEIQVSGGGATGLATYGMPLIVSDVPAPPGVQAFTAGAYKANGEVDTRAGAHPYSASSGILVNTVRAPSGVVMPAGEFRDILVDTPPGFFGNPLAAPACPEAFEHEDCMQDSIVATVQAPLRLGGSGEVNPVNNIQAPFGYPAKFRFITGLKNVIINVVASLRSDEDHGLEVGSFNTPQIKPVFGAFFTIWGTPLDESHDGQRCKALSGDPLDEGPPPHDCVTAQEILDGGGEKVAFLTNPVDCAEEAIRPPVATINVNTWQNPGLLFSNDVALQPVTGCDDEELKERAEGLLESFDFEPTGAQASDSPASFRTEMSVSSEGLLDPDRRITPTIKEAVVDLPEGVVLNASAADGLAACSFAQIGYLGSDFPRPNEIRFTKAPHQCPNASKIGTGELKSELIAEPLSADLFLAEQGNGNPFGSLFAIYLVIESERNGIFIKLPGEVQVNQQTGKQRIVFKDLPPYPFRDLGLSLKGGPRSPLATPSTCGNYATTATNTPWSAPESGPPHVTGNSFTVNQGPGGLPCANTPAERPFSIGLSAGSSNPVAGAHSPFGIQVTRPDGNQELDRLEIAMPPGFVASLKGIPYCSEAQIQAAEANRGKAEQANPSCPAASRIGSTNSGAGSGPTPYYAPGALYLSAPYKNHPLSVVAITPAVAGPFDLGNVVVRSALRVDPVTARITAITDPLPRILEGVPLRVRDIRINLDRANWAQNPTSCEEKSIDVTAHGANGAVSNPSNRFQVGNCAALAFKPRVNLQLFGGTTRAKYQAVRAVVRPRPGDANISGAVIRFPTSAFVAQEHLNNICTRVQWAADACPKGSIYGQAIAHSPLLDEPLKGTVHLRSSNNLLPDLVADLRGPAHQPIRVEVAIRNDSVKGALRNTVQAAPDAPVSFFRVQTFGGKKGLIVNSRNICQGRNAAQVTFRAHNGRRSTQSVPVRNARCAKQRKAAQRKAKAKARAQAKAKRVNAQRAKS